MWNRVAHPKYIMAKKNNPGCNCCSCLDAFNTDDFSEEKDGYLATGGPWFVSGGVLNTSSYGSYYRTVSIPDPTNLRLRVEVNALDLASGHCTQAGVFVGGVVSCYREHIGGGVFRAYMGLGVDAFGQNPTSTINFNFASSSRVTIWIEADRLNTGVFHVRATGGLGGDYVVDVPISFGGSATVGMFGDGRFDSFQWHVSRKANGHCVNCAGCTNGDIPPEVYLSVPTLEDDRCDCVQLSGNHVLTYRTFTNTRSCIWSVGCGWASAGVGGCNSEDVCPDGYLWLLSGSRLESTTSVNIMIYDLVGSEFDCSPGATNTFSWSCTVCDGACVSHPDFLFTVNAS